RGGSGPTDLARPHRRGRPVAERLSLALHALRVGGAQPPLPVALLRRARVLPALAVDRRDGTRGPPGRTALLRHALRLSPGAGMASGLGGRRILGREV